MHSKVHRIDSGCCDWMPNGQARNTGLYGYPMDYDAEVICAENYLYAPSLASKITDGSNTSTVCHNLSYTIAS